MAHKIAIVDYSVGNLFNLTSALEHIDADVNVVSEPAKLSDYSHIILPGVGSFQRAANLLNESGMSDAVMLAAEKQRHIMGICVGMQLLATRGEENGMTDGLGLIPGVVREIEPYDEDGTRLTLPHVGWTRLHQARDWTNSVMETCGEDTYVFCVHSYQFNVENAEHSLAHCTYGKNNICLAVESHTISGLQFHPELSGKAGLSVLGKFASL